MARSDPDITVEVVYALPHRQTLVTLTVHAGATVREAVAVSGLAAAYPDMNATPRGTALFGIFGRHVSPDTVLNSGDRIEIYRLLTADPKEARRRRARKSQ